MVLPRVRRRRRRRGGRGVRGRSPSPGRLLLGGAALVCALSWAGQALRWLGAHWWVPLLGAAAAVAAVAVVRERRVRRAGEERSRLRALRYQLTYLDGLHHTRFEHAIRELMSRDGCVDAVRTGGRGDNGCDVKATDPGGRRWVIQCKHRRAGPAGQPVGTPDLHVLNGTARQVHGADVAVLVTNGRFTAPALSFGASQRLHLVDRQLLAGWAAGSLPLWELLDRLPPPPRAARLP